MNESQKIAGHLAKTQAQVDSPQGLAALICHNLSNFAYRYISTEATSAPEAREIENGFFIAESIEGDLIKGLKLGGEEVRAKLIAMARELGKGATIGQRLVVDVGSVDPGRPFIATLKAQISWDHPEHTYQRNYAESSVKVEYENALDMRNRLAQALEEVCAFF